MQLDRVPGQLFVALVDRRTAGEPYIRWLRAATTELITNESLRMRRIITRARQLPSLFCSGALILIPGENLDGPAAHLAK